MTSRREIRAKILDQAVRALVDRVVTLEEAEIMIELVLDHLITNHHMEITDLGFERLPTGGCDVEIYYTN